MTAPAPNPGEQVGQLLYQLLSVEVLQRVLRNARDGSLVPHWHELVRLDTQPFQRARVSSLTGRGGLG
jgi:hypothetical protein